MKNNGRQQMNLTLLQMDNNHTEEDERNNQNNSGKEYFDWILED